MTEPLRLRVGRHVGRTLYRQVGDEASRADVLVGVMDTPELAAVVVAAVNDRGDDRGDDPGQARGAADMVGG